MEENRSPKKKRTRRQTFLILSGATTAVVVVALFLLNVLAAVITERYPITIDLTPQKAFELTEQSKKYISELEQPVTIQVMTTEENFMSGGEYFVQAHSVLEQYEKYSDKISVEYIDLLANPSLASQYEDVQIGDIIISGEMRNQTLTAYDLFEVQSGSYYGDYITASKAEQAMTSAILNVTSQSQVKVAVLEGHGEQYPEGFVRLLTANNFEVTQLNPATQEIPEDTEVLIWVAPNRDPDQAVLDKLNGFLSAKSGRNLLYFADTTQPQLPRLEAFLKQWGVSVQASSLLETDNSRIINANPYFATAQLSSEELTDTMTDLSVPMTLPFARPLERVFETNMDLSTTVLFESSETSTQIPYGLSEEELENWEPTEYSSYPLAILCKKSFEDGNSSQILVSGSSVSLSDSLLSSGSFSNADYYLSALNTLTHRENIVSIQSKTLGGKELGLNTAQVFVIGVCFMIVLPIVTLVCGMYLWLKRRNA